MRNSETPPKPALKDAFARHLNYLRLSVTDRCNLHCAYCVPRNHLPKLPHAEILRYEEALRLVHVFRDLGIEKIRITGGEPLVRQNVVDFIQSISATPGIQEVALTTNAVLLKENMDRLAAAGIRRLNISLDTLNPQIYREITGHYAFHQVWEGIIMAYEAGFSPIKINVVPMRGINDHELTDLARLSLMYPFHIRFIEQMPMGNGETVSSGPPLLTPEIQDRLKSLGPLEPVPQTPQDGPARRYRLPGGLGEIGFISPISHHFCGTCNRLRLTASGGLRVCLLSDEQTDLKTPLRGGSSDQELAGLIIGAVKRKPSGHRLADKDGQGVCGQMSSIGG